MKNCFSDPSSRVVVILEVEAELMPPPPWDETDVWDGSRESNWMTAESSFMVDVIADSLRIVENMDDEKTFPNSP